MNYAEQYFGRCDDVDSLHSESEHCKNWVPDLAESTHPQDERFSEMALLALKRIVEIALNNPLNPQLQAARGYAEAVLEEAALASRIRERG